MSLAYIDGLAIEGHARYARPPKLPPGATGLMRGAYLSRDYSKLGLKVASKLEIGFATYYPGRTSRKRPKVNQA